MAQWEEIEPIAVALSAHQLPVNRLLQALIAMKTPSIIGILTAFQSGFIVICVVEETSYVRIKIPLLFIGYGVGLEPVCITNNMKKSRGGDADFFRIKQSLNHTEVDASAAGRLLSRANSIGRALRMGHQHSGLDSVAWVWGLCSRVISCLLGWTFNVQLLSRAIVVLPAVAPRLTA